MGLEGKTVAEVGELLAAEFGESDIDFRMLAKDNFINGRVALGMVADDWIAIGLHRCLAAGVQHLVRSFQAGKQVQEDHEEGMQHHTPISSETLTRQKNARTSQSTDESSELDPIAHAAMLGEAVKMRDVIRAEIPNYWKARLKGPMTKWTRAKQTEIVNKLYGVDCSLELRASAKKAITTKLSAMRRSVKRHQQALSEDKNLKRRYVFKSTSVDMFAYPKKLKNVDYEFFNELHQARMPKPHQYMEVKVASGIIEQRIAPENHPYKALEIKVVTKYATTNDYRLPFCAGSPVIKEGQPQWMSQVNLQDTIYWPECCTKPTNKDLFEASSDEDNEEPMRQHSQLNVKEAITVEKSPKLHDRVDGTWEFEPEIISVPAPPIARRSPIPVQESTGPQPVPDSGHSIASPTITFARPADVPTPINDSAPVTVNSSMLASAPQNLPPPTESETVNASSPPPAIAVQHTCTSDDDKSEESDDQDNNPVLQHSVPDRSPGQGRFSRRQRQYSRARTQLAQGTGEKRAATKPASTNGAPLKKATPATNNVPATMSAVTRETQEIDVEERLKDLSIENIKFLGSVLLKRKVSEVNLVAIKTYASGVNKRNGMKLFTITNSMKFSPAINHVLKRAIATGILKVASEAWDDKSFNEETVSLADSTL